WLKHWYDTGITDKYLHKNDASEKRFSFQDGPITANNPMGVHHAWGRSYKDLWQKFHNLLGYKQRFVSGFDCQGLWVEVEVEKELGLKSKKDIENLVPGDKDASIAKFVQLCKDRVHKYADIQTDQSKRLGYFMDWENSYYTMSDDNNYMIWKFLKQCFENGWVYKGHESVPWCPRCETAISQHEMLTEDYKEVTHDSIYMEFKLVDAEHEYLVVWTTTPWTIPANIAVAVDKTFDYALVEGETGDQFWVVKDRVEALFGKDAKIIKIVKGQELVGRKYKGLFDDLEIVQKTAAEDPDTFHTIVATDPLILPILTTEGTGLVHTAVSAGVEDFKLGKKLGLPMIPVIADNADYLPHMGFLAGKNAKNDPWIILGNLKERDKAGENLIFKIEKYKHRYPGCWRCKAELVWKVADEWYIAMDFPVQKKMRNEKLEILNDKRTLRERMIEVAKKITWMPSFGLDRELDWLKNMHDWLISKKNRYWGLALPIYECKDCESFEVIGSKEELKERAVSGWEQFEGKTPHKPFIDGVKIACQKCGKSIERIGDVGNPWLDAGIVPFSTIKEHNQGEPLYTKNREEWQKWFPADFITESFPGQFKNWFYAMIAMSTVLEDTNPFKRVLGYATLTGEDGRPMHKSWGNSIAFHEGADEIGVDVMRWMYARQNPAENLLFGYKKADEVRRQFYILTWNIYKFYRQNAEVDGVSYNKKEFKLSDFSSVLDQWILSRFKETITTTKESLAEYDTKLMTTAVEDFIQDLSTWYVRRSRDRVGVTADQADKAHFYQVMQYIFVNLMIALSPVVPYLTEELYTQITGLESVHLTSWPELEGLKPDEKLIGDMKIVREMVEVGHRVRKDLQFKVRQPLASITVSCPASHRFETDTNSDQYFALIEAELNVKKVILKDSSDDTLSVEYDTTLTPELQLEGEVRDLVRQIQNMRKKLGIDVTSQIELTMPERFRTEESTITAQVQAKTVMYGDVVKVSINT
ncbi:class I tRNA ligase family protein, partial [Candidatus Woesebacteria bacterium]|nr:class I tRNA ligase family protein [Candidatus Woesebacteria bacterium]